MLSKDFQVILFCLLLGGLVIFLLWFFIFKVKHLKIPDVFLVTGGVKTGKSFVSVWLAVKYYKRAVRKWWIKRILIMAIVNPFRFIRKKPLIDLNDKEHMKPMLYSNMHLRNVKYNLLTLDIILRAKRVPVGSVLLIDEVSLFADSMLVTTKRYQKEHLHEKLMLFIKLFGHYCGGKCIFNTQALGDCTFEIKRCVSSFLWIETRTKYPFFSLLRVREMVYGDELNIQNTITSDAEIDNRPLFIWNKYMKYYDYRCYSVFTDGLEMQVDYDNPVRRKGDSLKTKVLLTLQEFETLQEFAMRNESEVIEDEKA